jgi:hypothetical protein
MDTLSSLSRSVAAISILSAALTGIAWCADPPAAAKPAATKAATTATATTATTAADPLAADVLADTELAAARGGTDNHLNQTTATGTVTGNTASQINTGTNTISESAFSNSSGIPIVIQNSGNNVLIQNSTILNLQLTNPK